MNEFLPITYEELQQQGSHYADFVFVTGDAYVDHPSFGAAIITRLLQKLGFTVAVLAQPTFSNCEDFKRFRRPRYAFLINGGNIDSMVAHYTASKKRRSNDEYSPGSRAGLRPDRAVTVYSKLAKEAYPDTPVIIGGLEASLRRFAHYDYWDDRVMPSVLESSGADLLLFGMGERSITQLAKRFAARQSIDEMTDIAGSCYLESDIKKIPSGARQIPSLGKVRSDKEAYMRAAILQQQNNDALNAEILVQKQKDRYLVQNLPSEPLDRAELDEIYDLPYARKPHPSYDAVGGVKSIEEVQFSIIHNRGCFGGCNFCALTMHQGRRVTSRSHDSVLREAKLITEMPNFKGYIHDVGGPTANFRSASCKKQLTKGVCKDRQCLFPRPCPSLFVDHSDYADLLAEIAKLPKVKKVFVRSGIRYDYLLADSDPRFMNQLISQHVSGQLKVAPEHTEPKTLRYMGKPDISVFDTFRKRYSVLSKKAGKEQYLVPYLMSSHPGCTLQSARSMAAYLTQNRIHPEQVQDFYPTPGTLSTAMFYTDLDPYTLQPLYVAKRSSDKSAQRTLLKPHKMQSGTPRAQGGISAKRVQGGGKGVSINRNKAQGQKSKAHGTSSVSKSSSRHQRKKKD